MSKRARQSGPAAGEKKVKSASVWDQMEASFSNKQNRFSSPKDALITLNNGVEYPVVGFGTFHLNGKECTE